MKSYKLEYLIPKKEQEVKEGQDPAAQGQQGQQEQQQQEQQEPEEEEEEGQGVWTLTRRGELLSYVKGQPAPDYRVDGAPLLLITAYNCLCCFLPFCGQSACPPLIAKLCLCTINPPVPGLPPTLCVQRSVGRRWSGARWHESWLTTAPCAA